MKEQSQIDEMRAAVRGDRERAEERRQGLSAQRPALDARPLPARGRSLRARLAALVRPGLKGSD